MSVPFATRVAVRSEVEPRQLGPLAFAEVLFRALSAPRPQRLLVTPDDDSGPLFVRVVDSGVLALTEGAEEDLALALLRDGVISVDGLMRARRRSDNEHCTLVEGLLTEELVPTPELRDRVHAATKIVMEELFAVKAGHVEIEEDDHSARELLLRVKPDQFVVDFVRRAVTPLRARKVLGEVGDRFRLSAEADDRIGLCGFLAEERDVIEEFRDGGPLTELLLAREEGSQAAAQAIFAGLAIGLLEPDDGVDLWEDIEVPDKDADSKGFAVPGFSKFAGGASEVSRATNGKDKALEKTQEIEVEVEAAPDPAPEPEPEPAADPAPIPEEPETPTVEDVHLLEDVVEEPTHPEPLTVELDPARAFGQESLLQTRTEEDARPVVRPTPTPPLGRPGPPRTPPDPAPTPTFKPPRPASLPAPVPESPAPPPVAAPMRDLTDLSPPREPKKTPVTREIPILMEEDGRPEVLAPTPLPPAAATTLAERLRWGVTGGGVVLLSMAMGWTIARSSVTPVGTPAVVQTATPTRVVEVSPPPPTRTPTPEIVVATPRPTKRPPKPVDPATLKRRQAAKLFAAGKASHRAGRVSEAVDKFEQAVDLDPGSARIHAHLALALYDLDDLSGAEQTARKAVRINTREPWAHLALANVHQAQGRNSQAIQSYETFLKLKPSGPMAKDVRQIVDMLRTAP